MPERYKQPHLEVTGLTREIAQEHIDDLVRLANQIPEVTYSPEDILADQKGDRLQHNKWDHSLVVFDGGSPVALVMGYERQAEGNDQYPRDTIYISELAVAQTHQGRGVARRLLAEFFRNSFKSGFRTLKGELNYSIQTNSAEWNEHVVELYESFGFKKRALKDYPNRTDVVLGVSAEDLSL